MKKMKIDIFRLLLIVSLAFLMISCQFLSAPNVQQDMSQAVQPSATLKSDSLKTFENDDFSLKYPSDWRTPKEIFGFESKTKHDPDLEADIIFTITNATKSSFGEKYTAWCSVLTRENSSAQSVAEIITKSYSILKNYQNPEISLRDVAVNGLSAVEKIYRRPRGEPWYQVRDLWLQQGSRIFIISCWSYPSSFEKNQMYFDEIIASFIIK